MSFVKDDLDFFHRRENCLTIEEDLSLYKNNLFFVDYHVFTNDVIKDIKIIGFIRR